VFVVSYNFNCVLMPWRCSSY